MDQTDETDLSKKRLMWAPRRTQQPVFWFQVDHQIQDISNEQIISLGLLGHPLPWLRWWRKLFLPSKMRRCQSLDLSKRAGLRATKQLTVRRAVLRHGVPLPRKIGASSPA